MRKGWKLEELGNLGTLTSSKRIFKKEYVKEGVPFYRSKEIKELGNNKNVSLELFITRTRYEEIKKQFGIPKEGDILLTAVGTIGEMYVVDESHDFYFKDGNIMWLKNFDTLDPYYLKYTLTLFVDQLKAMSQGSAYNALTIEKLKKYLIPIPTLSEQIQIVSILDEAFTSIDKAKANVEKNLQNAKELFQSKLNEVFSQRGLNWIQTTLGEVCSLITDGKHGDCENETGSGYYFLSAKDVKYDTLNYENSRQITETGFLETHRRTNLMPGDICMVNTGATIGRFAIAPDDPKTYRTTFQKSVAVIKTIPTQLNNRFCCYILMSDLKKLTRASSGSAVKNLLLGSLKKHIINMPKSVEEQEGIVDFLDSLSIPIKELSLKYEQKLLDLEELKKSILQKAFTGELTSNDIEVCN